MYHAEKGRDASVPTDLLSRLWEAVPRTLSRRASAAYMENVDWDLMRAHGRHYSSNKNEPARNSFHADRDLLLAEAGEYVLHHVLNQRLRTRHETEFALWQEKDDVRYKQLKFRFEEQGNIIVTDTSKSARRQKLAEFDACLIDKSGSLYFLDATISSSNLQKKLHTHHRGRIEDVLREVRNAWSTQVCHGHVYLISDGTRHQSDMSAPNVAVWRAIDFLQELTIPIGHYAQGQDGRISTPAAIQ